MIGHAGPTLISLKVNHYCRVVLTTLIKANAILKCLNDLSIIIIIINTSHACLLLGHCLD